MIDNATLLIGIAFSCASLMVALVIGWLMARRETYLIHGATGLFLIVAAVVIMGLRNGTYHLAVQLIPFIMLETGFAFIYAGSLLFRNKAADLRPAAFVGGLAIIATAVPLLMGLSGVGTIMLNAWCAIIMMLCAWEYWRGHDDVRMAVVTNGALYAITALSFLACAAVLLIERQWVLSAPPDNLAEDINSIVSLVGITGIGATTMALHYARAARRHRVEANTDSLTGVLNRRALFSRFGDDDVVAGLAVLMFDLDHFKQINDHHGHAQGDLVLQRFADVMRSQLRDADTVARLGGEEFCVILPGLDRDTARAVAERIRVGFAALDIPIGPSGATATVSAGLATAGSDETFASVLSRADAALYKAKSAGRNQVHLANLRLVA